MVKARWHLRSAGNQNPTNSVIIQEANTRESHPLVLVMSTSDTNSALPTIVSETPSELLDDGVNLIASTLICGVAYGILITLFAICAYFLTSEWRSNGRRTPLYQLIYIVIMFSCATVYVAASARGINQSFVGSAGETFPGGPSAYNLTLFSEGINIAGTSIYFIMNWMADALLVGCSVFPQNSDVNIDL